MSTFDPQVVERFCETLFENMRLPNKRLRATVTQYAGIGQLNISSNCTLREFEQFMNLLRRFVLSIQIDTPASDDAGTCIPSTPTTQHVPASSIREASSGSTSAKSQDHYQIYYAVRTPLSPGGLTPMQLLSRSGASSVTTPNISSTSSFSHTSVSLSLNHSSVTTSAASSGPVCLLLFKTIDAPLSSILALQQDGGGRKINTGMSGGDEYIPLFPVDPREFTKALRVDANSAVGSGGSSSSGGEEVDYSLKTFLNSPHYRHSMELVNNIRAASSPGMRNITEERVEWGMKICHISQSPEMLFIASIFNNNETSSAKSGIGISPQHSDTVVIWNTSENENSKPSCGSTNGYTTLTSTANHSSDWATTIVNRAANCPSVFAQKHSLEEITTLTQDMYVFNPLTLRVESAYNSYMAPHLQLRRRMAAQCLTSVVRFALHPLACDCGASFSQLYLFEASQVKHENQAVWKLVTSHTTNCITSSVRYQPIALVHTVASIVTDVAAQQQSANNDVVDSGKGFSSAFCAFVDECEGNRNKEQIPLTTELMQLLVNNRF